jgi:hypothetical protein
VVRGILINLLILFFFLTQASAQVAKNLGTKPDGFGSSAQALALIDLIARNPKQSTYQITYKTSTDIVVFECDFNKDIIIRTCKRSKGRSTIEQWTGQAPERLRRAANGGSFDDTPKGHVPGTIRFF